MIESDEVVPSSSTELPSPSVAESMLVSGGVVSTVHFHKAGVGSSFPTASTAATVNMYVPSARSLYVLGLVQSVVSPGGDIVHTKDSASSLGIPENVKVIESFEVVPDISYRHTITVCSRVYAGIRGCGIYSPFP